MNQIRCGKILAAVYLEKDGEGTGSEAQTVSRTQIRRTTKADGKVWKWGAMKGFYTKPNDLVRGEF